MFLGRKPKGQSNSKPNTNGRNALQVTGRAIVGEIIAVVCPECGYAFQWDTGGEGAVGEVVCPECGATFTLGENTDGNASATMEGDSSIEAEGFDLTCPECGETFVWEIPESDEGGTATQQEAQRGRRTGHARGTTQTASIEIAQCPSCGAVFEYDTEPAVEEGSTSSNLQASSPRQSTYEQGVLEERKRNARMVALKTRYPDHAALIDRANQSGKTLSQTHALILAAKGASGSECKGARPNTRLGKMRHDAAPLTEGLAVRNGRGGSAQGQLLAVINKRRGIEHE